MENQNHTDQELQNTSNSGITSSQSPSNHVHKLSRYLLLFSALIGISSSIFVFYLYFTYQPPQTSMQEKKNVDQTSISPATSNSVGANWKTYTDPIKTYSFQYPPSGQVSNQKETTFISNSSEPPYYIFTVEVIRNSKRLSTEDAVANYIDDIRNNKNTPGTVEWSNRIEKTVKPYSSGEINGLSLRRNQQVGTVTDSFVVIEATENYIYTFSIHDGNGSVSQDQIDLIDQILSTFKFLDKTIDWSKIIDSANYKIVDSGWSIIAETKTKKSSLSLKDYVNTVNDAYKSDDLCNNCFKLFMQKTEVVNGYNTLIQNISVHPAGNIMNAYILINDSKVVSITALTPEGFKNDLDKPLTANHYSEFDQILSTFRFD